MQEEITKKFTELSERLKGVRERMDESTETLRRILEDDKKAVKSNPAE